MELIFLQNEAALLIGRDLVISDIHIGIEKKYADSGIKLPSQTEDIICRVEKLVKENSPERLFILGDLKSEVPGISFKEMRDIPLFFERITKLVGVEILPGNHDTELKEILEKYNVKIHPSKGLLAGEVFLTHGHTWPSEDFMKSKFVVTGHFHPHIEIKDRMGYVWKEPSWIVADMNAKDAKDQYKEVPESLPKLVMVPSFNFFTGGFAVNRKPLKEYSSPLLNMADMKKSRAYMLDGTPLGKVKSLR